MRPELGLATLPQRLAGIATLRPGGTATGGAQTSSFAATLAQQVQTLAAPPSSASTAPSWGPAGTSLGTATALGPGVALHRGPSVIRPQLPYDTAGIAPADHDHDHAPGPLALDRSGPPAELQTYGNGRIPTTALESLGVGDHRLWSPAARAFRDMEAAAAREGVQIGVNDSYRDLDGQVEMVQRYGLYSQGGRAAAPGTSNHGWGVALDLDLDGRAQSWMREHAADYGFVEDVPREPWHWTFKASGY